MLNYCALNLEEKVGGGDLCLMILRVISKLSDSYIVVCVCVRK